MKINSIKLLFTKKSCLLVGFFACMFVFASFTKEDRQRVREFKKELLSKLADKKVDSLDQDLKEETSAKPIAKEDEKFANKTIGEPNHLLISDLVKVNNAASSNRSETSVNSSSYASKEKEGTIGVFSDEEEDRISDNFFTIDIPAVPKENATVYLEYDLFGLASHESVSRSINHNVAIGGGIIMPSGQWSQQKEAISANLIKTGINSILFTSPAAGVKYKIRNLKLVFEKDKNSGNNLLVSSILSGDQLYVKGSNTNAKDLTINNEHLSVENGEFEKVIKLSEKDKAVGLFSITNNGISNTYKIPNPVNSFKVVNNGYAIPKGIEISKDKEFTHDYENMRVSIEKETSESAFIEVLKLREKDFPVVSQGVKNVTLHNNAYRFSVVSGKLNKKVKISIPYDVKRLGLFSPKEIQVFHFDYAKKLWVTDHSVVDEKNKTVTVEGDGDNDYINGIISSPESPQTNAFSPTSISGLKAADPMSGQQLMSPPTTSQKGDVNTSYPINVPAGLGGLQPSLSIGYSSGGGNGWMGEGWDLQGLSAITVDTRWGAPLFGPEETELYSLDGEMLVYPDGYMPHRHNDVSENSTDITIARQARTAGSKRFYLRKNHDFTIIERNGNGPGDYSWTVTSTNGTKSYYGGSTDSVIKDANNRIVHWGLRMIVDAHGNTMAFSYQNTQLNMAAGSNLTDGIYFHIQKITYGKNQDYAVTFNTETGISRSDIGMNAKQGVKRVEPYLLNNVVVSHKTAKIRTYHLEYEEGPFSKTRLKRLYIKVPRFKDPAPLPIIDDYSFDYFNEVDNNQIFGPDTHIQVDNQEQAYTGGLIGSLKPSKINGNISSEKGLNFRPAAGLNFFTPSNDGYGHLMFGFPFGFSSAEAKNAQQLIDFNGDGIQDMIYRVPNKGLYFSEGSLASGHLSFLPAKEIKNFNSNFSYTETKTNSSGWDMGAIVYSKSEIGSRSTGTTSTYLIDANSDGLVDIVDNGQVWFNRYNQGLKTSEMTKFSEYTENMVVKAKPIMPPMTAPPGPKDPPIIAPEYPPVPITDVVKVWIASKDGYISFSDNISVSNYTTIQNPPQKIYYSVEILKPNNGASSPSNGRIYLKEMHPGDPVQRVYISKYNDYYSQIQSVPPVDSQTNIPEGINDSNRLFVKSGEKVYVRLHKSTNENLEISSNPTINYVNTDGQLISNTYELSQDQFKLNNGSYGNNFLLNNLLSPIYLDAAGTAQINIRSVSFPYAKEAFIFKVIKENAITGQNTVLYSQEYLESDNPFETDPFSTSLSVSASEPCYLKFVVESDFNTSFKGNNWNNAIKVEYSALSTSNIDTYMDFYASAEYPSYAVTQFKEKIDIKNPQINPNLIQGSHKFSVQINKNVTNFLNLGTGDFYYVIKMGGTVLAKRKVTVISEINNYSVSESDMSTGQAIPGLSPVAFFKGFLGTMGDTSHLINIQVYCKTGGDYALFNKYSEYFQGKPFNVYYDDNNLLTPVTATSVNTAMYNTKSAISNNWGQFLYKPGSNNVYSYGTPILAEAFTADVSVQNTYPLCAGITGPQELADCINLKYGNPNTGNNPVSQFVSPMKPYSFWIIQNRPLPMKFVNQWIGASYEQFAGPTSFKNDETTNYFYDPIADTPPVVPSTFTAGQLSVDTTMKAISKKQSSNSRNKTEAASTSGISSGLSDTTLGKDGSIETQTFSDINGDGYPDMVYPESIQFTNSTGSLENMKLVPSGDFPTSSYSYQKMRSTGFSFNAFSVSGRINVNGSSGTSSKPDSSMPWSGGASIGAGSNEYFNSTDYGQSFWLDINGDGLPDRIINSGSRLMFNLGNSLSGVYTFENMTTYRSHPLVSTSVSIGGGLGSFADLSALSGMGFGINAGVSGSASKGTADVVYEDINGDGLIDILDINNSPNNKSTSVRYNLGNKFAPAVPLLKSAGNLDFTEETGSYNGAFSFGGSFMLNIGPITLIPPTPLLILFIKAGAGATANLGINVSETKKAFKDMNGDGFVDLVVDNDTGFTVNYSLIGKTNKLKAITNNLTQGKYTVDYQFSKPTYNDPHAKLVVKEIRILNPDIFSPNYTQSDNEKDMVTRYTFENAKYDRRERDNFGFEKMISEQMDAGGNAYRRTINIYHNSSYFLNGMLKESQVQSGGGGLLSQVNYEYKVYKFKNNTTEIDLNPLPASYDTGGTEGRRMATVQLDKKSNIRYENGGQIKTVENMEYNRLGQVIKFQYASPSKTYNSRITYWTGLNNNIIGIPKQIDVYDGTGTGTLIRRRKTLEPNLINGDIGKYAIFDGSQDIETEYTYTPSGNIKTVKYPPNESSQRYSLTYEYDDNETGKNVVQVSDTFGYTSTATYQPFFDSVESSTDTGGNTMQTVHDEYGRIVVVVGPNDTAVNPTIRYAYYFDHYGIPNSDQHIKIFRARTSHYDPENPGNLINTDSYSDFMGRVIQVKKDIAVAGVERRSVSGRTVFDIFGRTVQQHHPIDEPLQNDNLNLDVSPYFTQNAYDLSDRVYLNKNEDNFEAINKFAIEGDFFKTTEEFQGMKTETLANAEGKVIDKYNYLDNDPLNTHFDYNAAGELTVVKDPEGIETFYYYNLAGRRTAMEHPDKGRTVYEYDPAGHLIKLHTANLVNAPSGPVDFIHYTYDHNRLTEIGLPNLPSGAVNPNNVRYTYMGANSGNNSGKVIIKSDGTGYTNYTYGKMGEVTSEIRRVFGYNVPTMEFRTDYVYDSWNRIKELTYPDHEKLFYTYDLGGNLKSVTNGNYNYIQNIQYDLYEQRTQVVYGNGTKTDFRYTPTNRRMYSHALWDATNHLLLNNSYDYDPIGNIKRIYNGAIVSPNEMGGGYGFNYFYDTLNRLIGTDGSMRMKDKADSPINPGTSPYPESNSMFTLKMKYNNAGGIIFKGQTHDVNQHQNQDNTYMNDYRYTGGTHKLQRVNDSASGLVQNFDYDYNGNVTRHEDRYGMKRLFWDEQDHMKAFYNEDAGTYHYYTYDDKGERTIKYRLSGGSQLYQNGELVDPGNVILNEYKLYPNPYVVVTSNGQYTKHYFEGSTRFASRLMDGNDIFIPQGTRMAGQNAPVPEPHPETDFKAYLDKAGIEGSILTSELGARNTPGNQPGLYYLHGDHLGTATFVTDYSGSTTQFFLNLPFGETMVEQRTGAFDNWYRFNAKELDKETNLYYYGARYYNPSLSIWYGVDPLAVYNPVMETEFYGNGQHNGGVFYWGNLNPYIYTYQNPINFIDPNGKQISLHKYGGGTVNYYEQKINSSGKPGKYEYTRIQGDSSKPITNVYKHIDNYTSHGYGETLESTNGDLRSKQVGITFKSGSINYEGEAGTIKNLNEVANSMTSVDQELAVYGSSPEGRETFVKDFDNNGEIQVEDLVNKRSDRIYGDLLNLGVNESNLKKGENKYNSKDSKTTILKYSLPAKQILRKDQISNQKPIIGYDAGK